MDESSFDQAAQTASEELKVDMKTWSPEQVQGAAKLARWFGKWFMTAGHKRLGRIVVLLGKGLL